MSYFQLVIRAGDNWVGVSRELPHFGTVGRGNEPRVWGQNWQKPIGISALAGLPKWEILSVDEGDRQEQPEEILGATGLR
jgi:hypothetical protein